MKTHCLQNSSLKEVSVLSEILANMLRRFSYTDFSEVLNPSIAEGTIGARIVTLSFTEACTECPKNAHPVPRF